MKGPGVNEGTRPKGSWDGSKGKSDREKARDAKHQQQQAERLAERFLMRVRQSTRPSRGVTKKRRGTGKKHEREPDNPGQVVCS
jgi:hypothetical protein